MSITKRDLNTSQIVGIGATVTLFTYRVPSKSQIKLTHFSNYLDIVAAWGLVTWRILRNGVGLYPYEAVLDQIGLSSRPREIEPLVISGGDEITITVQNGHVANVACGIALRYEIGIN